MANMRCLYTPATSCKEPIAGFKATDPCRRKTTGLQANCLGLSPRDEVGGNGSGGINDNNGGNSNNGRPDWGDSDGDGEEGRIKGGLLGLFLQGWRLRVEADPQFPFKVLMEEVVGMGSCLIGDMASRPNFGLNELDFVFSTLVVGSIMNFTLMYLLAPTSLVGGQALPGFFSCCPPSHMFETGSYGIVERLGTFVYKGALFSVTGFGAGLLGTALSNALINIRERMDPNFVSLNKAPPPLLNASTWALHMGFSSNLRYQTLNGIEFLLAKGLPPFRFKASVIALRCINNLLGGMSFVLLARLTGSQKVEESSLSPKEEKIVLSPGIELGDQSKDLQHSETS
ncbi:hypothetical protein SUGI_0885550 [Cryptomeria japonica]|nr:hypothetical protein SUGI_0885550 [Cryptomeria japonica]